MRKYCKIQNEDRRKIIESYLDGKTAIKIASIFRFKRTSIYSIIKKYKDGKPVERMRKGGIKRKILSDSDISPIKSWIDEDYSITLKQIKVRCENDLSIQVSKSSLARYIGNFNYTFKKISLLPERRNDLETIDLRAEYAESFMNIVSSIDDSKIFFIYEVGFNVCMRSSQGRSLKGTRAIKIVSSLRSRNISLCCVITKNGIFD
jgi:transposase